jgi:hypothetical protein
VCESAPGVFASVRAELFACDVGASSFAAVSELGFIGAEERGVACMNSRPGANDESTLSREA